MTEVRGDTKAALTEKKDYCKNSKEKQLEGSFEGGPLRKNQQMCQGDLGSLSDLFVGPYYLFKKLKKKREKASNTSNK